MASVSLVYFSLIVSNILNYRRLTLIPDVFTVFLNKDDDDDDNIVYMFAKILRIFLSCLTPHPHSHPATCGNVRKEQQLLYSVVFSKHRLLSIDHTRYLRCPHNVKKKNLGPL